MRHLSLFSGIGGFDLAAEWAGFDNIAQVEKDKFCQQVLKKNFPKTKIYDDIKTFPATDYIGRIDIITGGFPCQPFSQAGSRRGRDDDRHLWPEMLRIIQTIKPTWVVAENVRGLLTIEQGLAFEQICLDLEAIGAPHRRDRVWFIAHANTGQFNREESRSDKKESSETGSNRQEDDSTRQSPRADKSIFEDGQFAQYAANPSNKRLEGGGYETTGYPRQCHREWGDQRPDWSKDWLEVATELCSLDDGVSIELGQFKLSKSKHRAEQLKAYGNAIVPQIAFAIFQSLNL